MAKLKESEFEKDGMKPAGVQGAETASDKMKIIYRTGQDPDGGAVDLDKEPDNTWGNGGTNDE